VQDVTSGTAFPIKVPLRSEDDGENLQAELYLGYSLAEQVPKQEAFPITAGTLDELRDVDIEWNVPSNISGCQQLTLLVTHASNVIVRDKSDIATVTWWLNVDDDDDPSKGNLLRDCPKNTGTTN
jgi:hypothetical protein